jgi:hypothetical protein
MKSFFTKLSVLLFGVAFAVAGCQDYDEDIRKVNDQLNANTAELTSITDALDKAIKDLEAKMVADYATKKALADLSAELKAEIDADVAAAKTALEAAYKAADAALKSGYEAADAALKTELQNKINEAVKAAQDANDALGSNFEDSEVSSIGGFLINKIEHIPVMNEEFEINGYLFKVIATEKTRILRLKIKKNTSNEE